MRGSFTTSASSSSIVLLSGNTSARRNRSVIDSRLIAPVVSVIQTVLDPIRIGVAFAASRLRVTSKSRSEIWEEQESFTNRLMMLISLMLFAEFDNRGLARP